MPSKLIPLAWALKKQAIKRLTSDLNPDKMYSLERIENAKRGWKLELAIGQFQSS